MNNIWSLTDYITILNKPFIVCTKSIKTIKVTIDDLFIYTSNKERHSFSDNVKIPFFAKKNVSLKEKFDLINNLQNNT